MGDFDVSGDHSDYGSYTPYQPNAPEVSGGEGIETGASPEGGQEPSFEPDSYAAEQGQASAMQLDLIDTGLQSTADAQTEQARDDEERSDELRAEAKHEGNRVEESRAADQSRGLVLETVAVAKTGASALGTYSSAAGAASRLEIGLTAANSLATTAKAFRAAGPAGNILNIPGSSMDAASAWSEGRYFDMVASGMQAGGGSMVLGGVAATAVTGGPGAIAGVPLAAIGSGVALVGTGLEYGKLAYNYFTGPSKK